MTLVLSLLAGLLPANMAFAASRITITSTYVTDSPSEITDGRPTNDDLVPRSTSGTHNLLATVEGISNSELPNLYLNITNMSTGQTVVERSITAQKVGEFDVAFNNVPLTEGLNRIVVRLDGSSTVESAPGWIYYTATTNITNLTINGESFSEDRFFPSNPAQSSVINLSGRAPNATQVQAHLFGSPAPINGYFNQGEFFFIGDDINKASTTANLQLRPGDNPLTLFALNSSKSFQLQRTLIYDNGGPFAFRAMIQDGTPSAEKQPLVNNPVVQTPNVTVESLLKVDLNSSGLPEYRYVDVYAAGQRFGPYDLGGAATAERVANVYPKTVYQGHSAIEFVLEGASLDTTRLYIQDNAGIALPAPVEIPANKLADSKMYKTFVLQPSAAALLAANSPYKLTARNQSGDALAEFTINVVNPTATFPAVSAMTFAPANAGQTSGPTHSITFDPALTADDAAESFSIQITSLSGSPTGNATNVTGFAAGSDTVSFNLPSTLAQGDYKARVMFSGYPITERYFRVDGQVPALPTITNVVSGGAAVSVTGDAHTTPTYLFVRGTGFGTDRSLVSGQLVGASPADTVALTAEYVEDRLAVFQLPDTASLTDGEVYELQMTVPLGTVSEPNVITGMTLTAGPDYDGKVITGVSPLQVTADDILNPATRITMSGAFLDSPTGMLAVQVLNEDGVSVGTPVLTDLTDNSGVLAMPALTPGNYIIQISNTRNYTTATESVVIAQYPFTVTDPVPVSLSPDVWAIDTNPALENQALTLTGTNFGRDYRPYKLRFDSSELTTMVDAEKVIGGTQLIFDAPSGLPEGTYTATLIYNGEEVGDPITYTVSSPRANLRENAQWSKDGRYRVYEFSAQLNLTSERAQTLEFRFYNLATDQVPPTSFTFLYEDPTLPYIDHVEVSNAGQTYRISETVNNEINEQPMTLIVYTNANANSLNYYVGDYSSSAAPLASEFIGTENGLRKFAVELNGLPNGVNQVTFVPSTRLASLPLSKVGENLAGRKTYTFDVSSTPYVIVNNLHTGMIIKAIGELSCGTTSQCIQGRLINVPDYQRLQIIVNGTPFTLLPSEFTAATGTFNFRFGPGTSHLLPSADGGNLREGRNTIEFVIYEDSALTIPISRAVFEIFKFSTNAPEFLSLRPLENTDTVKYRPANVADSYATNETTVQLAGQFANATEIKLTVRTVDPVTGAVQTIYDRRYGSSFNQFEPTTNNPNYFSQINNPTAGQFLTRAIPLAARGDTVFEFSITNSTNIVVTKTITVTREPLPYVIISPKVTTNSRGQSQANINSNYVEFEIEAENADSVIFGREYAVERDVTDRSTGLRVKRFFYEARNLKNGNNNIKFTVVRGEEEIDGEIVVYNVNTPIEGAQYKTGISNRIRAFDNQINVTFPRNTVLMRNDPSAINQYITSDRQILFGIANSEDGRVDKFKHPAPYDGQIGNPNPLIPSNAKLILSEPTGRFRPVSPLYWIDAGTIKKDEADMSKALSGSGRLPYDEESFYNRNLEDLVVPSQPGTLTLNYDPIIRNDGWKYVTVYHYDIYEDYRGVVGPRWRNIGGVVDANKNTITVPVERFGYYQVMYMDQSYDDVITHAWARNELDILFSKGIMLNKNSTSFVPNDPISRGEFATLLVKIFDIPLQYTERPTFTDVLRVNPQANGLYDYKYIETAARAGIVRGAGGGRFQPDASITREDAAVMIARAANLRLGSDDQRNLTQLQKEFTDANGINVYARAAVLAVADKGFIEGKENIMLEGQRRPTYRFDPTSNFTRAEAAAVAVRVMRDEKKIPK